jgi:hypothetical protein
MTACDKEADCIRPQEFDSELDVCWLEAPAGPGLVSEGARAKLPLPLLWSPDDILGQGSCSVKAARARVAALWR